MANTYWIRSHGVRKKPIHSCTLQRMYHSVTDPVKHLLLIVKEHLLIAALQNVAPPPKRNDPAIDPSLLRTPDVTSLINVYFVKYVD